MVQVRFVATLVRLVPVARYNPLWHFFVVFIGENPDDRRACHTNRSDDAW